MSQRMQEVPRSRYIAAMSTFVAALVCAAPLSALAQGSAKAGADWEKILAAAKKEGKVVLYTGTVAPVMQRIKEEFDNAYPGITLEWVRYASGPLIAKVEQERKAGVTSADVVSATEVGWFENRAKEGVLARAVGPDAARFPANYLVEGVAPILSMDVVVMVYNTNLIKTPITGYKDVLRPEFKGKIGMVDLLSTTVVAFYSWLEQVNGAGYLDRLADQKPMLYTGAVGGGQSVASGEIAIATFIGTAAAIPLIKSGAPVKIVYPNPGFGFAWAGAIIGWGGHPNAAQVFMNYVMSPRGQTVWNGDGNSASALPNIPGSLDASTLNLPDLKKFPPEAVKPFTARWNKLFK